jgi:small conductance mechanosensitive channel
MTIIEHNLRIILSILLMLVGLVVGLILRRLLVRRLKKTVLDDWLVQTLGVVPVLLPLIIALAGSAGILTNSVKQLLDLWQQISVTTGTKPQDVYNFVKELLLSLLIIILAIGVARTLSKLTLRGIGENRLAFNLRIVINRISYILVMLIAIFWILALWQVSIELPVAVLGTLTVAVSFSIQDILKDLVAGLYILLERPFFIGDQISTDKYTGQVEGVELRATRLRLVSGEEVTVPNALVFGGVVINNSRYAERRATILITLPLEDFSREETPEHILGSLRELAGVLVKPEPTISVSGIAKENVELTLHFWIIAGQLATVTDVVYALHTLLPHADLGVKETAGDV